jgi:hypothetical protein
VDLPVEDVVLSLALSPEYTRDKTLFVGMENQGLFCSQDEGMNWHKLAENDINDVVNGIIISPEFPAKPEILLHLGDKLLISRNMGQSWAEAHKDVNLAQGITALAAPQGLALNVPLLVGLLEGGIVRDKLFH